MVSEEKIYMWTKKFFLEYEWKPLGGDPPQGTDLPRLEISEPNTVHSLKKNKNSIINDLVFCKKSTILLIECKDSEGKIESDIQKLRIFQESKNWRESLVKSMEERSMFNRFSSDLDRQSIVDGTALVPVLAFSGQFRTSLESFIQILYDEEGNQRFRVGKQVNHSGIP